MNDITSSSAATLIRRAQREGGLSVSELARRCGINRVQLQRYASGSAEPSWSNLARVLAGAGMTLSASPPRPFLALERHREEVEAAGRARGFDTATLFGSAARGSDHPGSDLDLLVDGDLGTSDLRFAAAELAEELTSLLGVAVDVVTEATALGAVAAAARREGVVLWS